MAEAHCCSIAIVGGGCSGVLVAAQLFRNGFQGSLAVIEPRELLGNGLAYSTSFDQHLLNVPAAKMSALPREPLHFLEWLRARHWPDAAPDTFAPRRLYGLYLQDLLLQAISTGSGSSFRHIRAEATGVGIDPVGVRLSLNNGATVRAERAVLALGNPASSLCPGVTRHGLEDCWHLSPWFGDALRVRFAGERILLLGTGLTAVDSALALQSQDMPCAVYMVSRRGILPQVHNLAVPVSAPPLLRNRGSVRLLLRELRAHIEDARQADRCWRAIVDALRPVSNEIWLQLGVAERKRFIRHLKPYWESHRHRLAPEIRDRLDGYRAGGSLQVIAGRLRSVPSHEGSSQVRLRLKRGGEQLLEVDRIISCTGIQENYSNSPRPLIRSLVESGLACANDLEIGFRTDAHGAMLNAALTPSSVLFTLGPPRRGELFETTAVPEIRAQAEALGLHLAGQ
jgi:uncharacterized NAD(P)/FAD-binding protein YdhS